MSWQSHAVVAGLPAVVLIAMLWPALHSSWISSYTYAHGYLVLAIVVWIAARELRVDQRPSVEPSFVGVGVLLLAVVGAVVTRASDVLLGQQLSVPAVAFATLWAVAGWSTAWRFRGALLYLLFGIAAWDVLNEPLRGLTTWIVGNWTRLSGIPVFIENNTIRIPSGTFEVAGGCSGLHYLVVASALAALYAMLNLNGIGRRLALVAAAAGLAVLANWIRVFALIVVGHVSDMQSYLITVDHYVFGWILFFVVLCPVIFLARALEAVDLSKRSVAKVHAGTRRGHYAVTSSVVVIGLVGAWLNIAVAWRSVSEDAVPFELHSTGEWRLRSDWTNTKRPVYPGAGVGGGVFERADQVVSVFLAHYPQQRQGTEVVYFANQPYGAGAQVIRRDTLRITTAYGAVIPVLEAEVIDQDRGRRVVWSVMRIGGRITTSDLHAKLLQAFAAVQGRRDAQVMVLSADCGEHCRAAQAALREFAGDGALELLRCAWNPSESDVHGRFERDGEMCGDI